VPVTTVTPSFAADSASGAGRPSPEFAQYDECRHAHAYRTVDFSDFSPNGKRVRNSPLYPR